MRAAAPGGRRAAAAHRDADPVAAIRPRRQVHRPAAVLEGFAGEGGAHGRHHLGDPRPPLARRHAIELELLAHVAPGHDQVHPPPRQVVEDEQVLGQADGVVERRDQRGHAEADVGGARRHGGDDGERAGQIAVGGAVVLRNGDADAAEPVGPLGHLERGRIAVGQGGAGEVRVAEVEPHREQHAVSPLRVRAVAAGRPRLDAGDGRRRPALALYRYCVSDLSRRAGRLTGKFPMSV